MKYSAESRAREVAEYAQSRGWVTRTRNGWLQVRHCPVCRGGKHRDAWTFALNLEGAAGVCQRGSCGWQGTLSQLKAQLGDLVETIAPTRPKQRKLLADDDRDRWRRDHEALLSDEVNLRRIEEHRGLTVETLKEWKVGLRVDRDGATATLVLPYHGEDGRLVYAKLKRRTREGGKDIWREPKGQPQSYLWGSHRLHGTERVVVVEGEEDAMLLSQAGVENVVSVPDGAKISSAERNKPWLDRLEAFQEIVICLDNDKPGREGAEALAGLMGEERCRVVEYPRADGAKDATDYWRQGKLDDLVRAISEAKGKPHPLVVGIGSPDIADAIRRQHEDPDPHGISTGWRSVDELLGGMRPAELSILTAHTGCGKSAWVVNLLAQLAQSGTPVIGASFELSTEDYVWRFIQKITGKYPWGRPDSMAEPLTPTERDAALRTLGGLPLWIVRHFGIMGVEQFAEAIRYAARRLGVRVAVLDHIHFMLVGSGDEERHVLSDAMYKLKMLARELNISIVVVAHPSRAARGKSSPDLSDLHGSASLEQIADNVLTLARIQEAETASSGRAVFAVKKLRAGRSGRLGSVEMLFRRAGESFEDLDAEWQGGEEEEGEDFAEAF